MEDYIFLLIAVALSIFGAINQNKKKKEAEKAHPEKMDRPRNFFMDQLLGEDFLAEPKVEVQQPMVIRPLLKKEPMVKPMPLKNTGLYHTGFASTLDRPKQQIQPTLRKPDISSIETESDDEETPGYLEDFSLRKAFIYSEIIQRKY